MALAAGEGDRPSLLITPAPIPGVGVSSGTISVSARGDLGGLGGGGEATGVAFISAAPAAASPVILRELDLSFSEWISDGGTVPPLSNLAKVSCGSDFTSPSKAIVFTRAHD